MEVEVGFIFEGKLGEDLQNRREKFSWKVIKDGSWKKVVTDGTN